MTKLLQEGPVGTKMGLHASKEGRLETKRGHDGANSQRGVGPAECAEMALGPAGGKGGSTKSI